MCLIIFAHQADARFPLIVAANRDEFYARPTQQADFWTDAGLPSPLLAGKDLLAGGTWLGMTASGRFAAVTNIRDPSQQEPRPHSRGELTRDFLQGTATPADYCQALATRLDDYAGFNLLVGDRATLCYLNNQTRQVEELVPGVYGLSNGRLNSPWPKVRKGRERLQELLLRDVTPDTDDLLLMMRDAEQASDAELPDTGVPVALERTLSSAFIRNAERRYGTLCSTAILIDAQGGCRFSEQNFDENGAAGSAHHYRFTLQP